MQPLHQIENRFSVSLVQVTGGLISQQYGWAVHQGSGDGDALLFPTGEFPSTLLRLRG
jgi:hypothetical protein